MAPVAFPADATVPSRFVPSPDGRRVAGTWFLEDETETFVVDAAGGGEQRTIPGGFGAWSPDGTETDLGPGTPPLTWTRG